MMLQALTLTQLLKKAGSEKGVTYDTAKHEVTVNVTDNGQGELVADVKDNNPTFTNTTKQLQQQLLSQLLKS